MTEDKNKATPEKETPKETPEAEKPAVETAKEEAKTEAAEASASESETTESPEAEVSEKEPEAEPEEKPIKVRRPSADPVRQAGGNRRLGLAAQSGGLIVILAVILVLLNWSLSGISYRLDTTHEERFSVSKGTQHLLTTLKPGKKLEMTVYAPEGLATIDAFVRDLRDLLNEYKRYGVTKECPEGCVTYQIVYPDRLNAEDRQRAEQEAKESGLKKQVIGEAKGGAAATTGTVGEGFLGMVMTYGGERAILDREEKFTPEWAVGLEFLITSKIREMRDKEDHIMHEIGYLEGHKEREHGQLSQVFQQFFPYYTLQAVNIKNGEAPIDEKLDGLIISSPEDPISDKELRRIDEFLMKGKAIAIFASNRMIKENDTKMQLITVDTGLEKLLKGYGIELKNNLLIDRAETWVTYRQTPYGHVIGSAYPGIFVADSGRPEKTLSSDFTPFFRLPNLAVPFPSELVVDPKAGGQGVTVKTVVQTTKNLFVVDDPQVEMSPVTWSSGIPNVNFKEERRQAIVGVDLEGPIVSAYPGGGDGITPPAVATGKARLLVVATSNFFTNPFEEAGKGRQMQGMPQAMGQDKDLMEYAQAYGSYPYQFSTLALEVAKQTCDWISNDTDTLATLSKLNAAPALTYRDVAPQPVPTPGADPSLFREEQMRWQSKVRWLQGEYAAINMFLGPLILLAIFLIRWFLRSGKQARKFSAQSF